MHKVKERKAVYTLDEVFNFIKENPDEGTFTDSIGNKSKLRRAKVFAQIGIKCVTCGLEGKYFAYELAFDDSIHLDLYGIDSNDEHILMTLDHILPASRGGKNTVDNYQCMCTHCNGNKGNLLDTEIEENKKIGVLFSKFLGLHNPTVEQLRTFLSLPIKNNMCYNKKDLTIAYTKKYREPYTNETIYMIGDVYYRPSHMNFKTDWNLLMLVYEKIEQVNKRIYESKNYCEIPIENKDSIKVWGKTKQDAIYRACIEYVTQTLMK